MFKFVMEREMLLGIKQRTERGKSKDAADMQSTRLQPSPVSVQGPHVDA